METTELKAYKDEMAKEIAIFIKGKCNEFESKTSLIASVSAETVDSYYENKIGRERLLHTKYKVKIIIK